ncbi:hypothetical protein ACFVZH_37170 [Streptomyces sp. NPDC059534]|uniref:hypothetical protein n=1 Tax=Streptomyces sp. NPDC059534 TaxID=3346859 RepID=UPI0036AE03C2
MVMARQTRAAALGGALALALTLAGCGGGDRDAKGSADSPPPATSTAAPAPATTSADTEAAEKKAVLAAFDAMWAERSKAYAKADAKGTSLEKYATLDALGKIRIDLTRMRQAGTVVRNAPRTTDSTVTSLDLTAKTPTAALTTCLDLSTYERYSTKRKEVIPLPSNQPLRYVATATLEKWPNGWMVTVYKPHGEQTC